MDPLIGGDISAASLCSSSSNSGLLVAQSRTAMPQLDSTSSSTASLGVTGTSPSQPGPHHHHHHSYLSYSPVQQPSVWMSPMNEASSLSHLPPLASQSHALETNLFVCNLPTDVNDEALENLFSRFGDVSSTFILRDIFSGVSRGIAFLEFFEPAAAAAAIQNMHGVTLPGASSPLVVEYGKRHTRGQPSTRVFVRNIPADIDRDVVKRTFAPFGTVASVSLLDDPIHRRLQQSAMMLAAASSGHQATIPQPISSAASSSPSAGAKSFDIRQKIAFVTFQTHEAAAAAASALHCTMPFASCTVPILTKVVEAVRNPRHHPPAACQDTSATVLGTPSTNPTAVAIVNGADADILDLETARSNDATSAVTQDDGISLSPPNATFSVCVNVPESHTAPAAAPPPAAAAFVHSSDAMIPSAVASFTHQTRPSQQPLVPVATHTAAPLLLPHRNALTPGNPSAIAFSPPPYASVASGQHHLVAAHQHHYLHQAQQQQLQQQHVMWHYQPQPPQQPQSLLMEGGSISIPFQHHNQQLPQHPSGSSYSSVYVLADPSSFANPRVVTMNTTGAYPSTAPMIPLQQHYSVPFPSPPDSVSHPTHFYVNGSPFSAGPSAGLSHPFATFM